MESWPGVKFNLDSFRTVWQLMNACDAYRKTEREESHDASDGDLNEDHLQRTFCEVVEKNEQAIS